MRPAISSLTTNSTPQALTSANALHTAGFDAFDMRTAGVDLYSINGCKSGTLGNIIERRSKDVFGNTLTSYDQPQEIPGDGTVPLESATNLPIDAGNRYYALKATHGKMLSQDGIRQKIVNLLSRSNLAIGNSLITQDETKCKLNGKSISLYSPVTITVVDALGNRASVSEDGSSVENTIPNANFEIMGEHKFVYLPDDEGQTYTISLQGSGNGVFTLRNQDISDNHVTQTEVFADLPVTTALSGEVHLDTVTTTLSLDTDGDGAIDQVVMPTVVVYPDTTAGSCHSVRSCVQDLLFTATDNQSAPEKVTIIDSNHALLTDEAGNTLDIGCRNK